MATFELPDLPTPRVSPHLLVGAASPLWGYFGAVAAGGVAWWWMTRWTQPANLEAVFGGLAKALPDALPGLVAAELTPPELTAPELAAPVAEPAEAVVATVEAAAPVLPPEPVGGEAAPISPIVEALAAPEPEPIPVEAAPIPAEVEAPEPIEAEPAKPRVRKSPTPNGSDAQP